MDPHAERDDLEAWLFTTGPLGNRPVFGIDKELSWPALRSRSATAGWGMRRPCQSEMITGASAEGMVMLVIEALDGATVECAGALVACEQAAARQVRPELPAAFDSPMSARLRCSACATAASTAWS